jgi:hypothetical protein
MTMDEEHGNKYLQIGEIMHRRISKQEGRKDSGYADSTKDLDINNNVYDDNHDYIIGLLFTETAPSVISLFSVAKRAIPSVQVARTLPIRRQNSSKQTKVYLIQIKGQDSTTLMALPLLKQIST